MLGDGHRIAAAALLGHGADGLEDQAVIVTMEVVRRDDVGNGIPGCGVQHEAAEYGLFGLDRVRRGPQRLDVAALGAAGSGGASGGVGVSNGDGGAGTQGSTFESGGGGAGGGGDSKKGGSGAIKGAGGGGGGSYGSSTPGLGGAGGNGAIVVQY